MNIGPLDKRCLIERRVTEQDPIYGAPTDAWEEVCKSWCNLQDELPSRSEALKNGLNIATGRTRLRMRYRADLDSSMRVTLYRPTAQIYQIIGGPAELGAKDGIELLLERYSA